MAAHTPPSPTSESVTPVQATETTDEPLEPGETRTQRLIDVGRDTPSSVTVSRAVRPPTVVRNKRLAADGVGEAYLVWRCLDCGVVGSLDAFPTQCVCGAGREDLAYVLED
ncbi:DUF7130 family rubredoxin-like protein [Salinigranum salinum]|uniref:DUF7130 family rubredoxin-like protein n=1 Tax=Salinigranum salinum TaxID=1364937 RepID=UPI001F048EEC|nr:hypothetical protein [Salinigranum salinum]